MLYLIWVLEVVLLVSSCCVLAGAEASSEYASALISDGASHVFMLNDTGTVARDLVGTGGNYTGLTDLIHGHKGPSVRLPGSVFLDGSGTTIHDGNEQTVIILPYTQRTPNSIDIQVGVLADHPNLGRRQPIVARQLMTANGAAFTQFCLEIDTFGHIAVRFEDPSERGKFNIITGPAMLPKWTGVSVVAATNSTSAGYDVRMEVNGYTAGTMSVSNSAWVDTDQPLYLGGTHNPLDVPLVFLGSLRAVHVDGTAVFGSANNVSLGHMHWQLPLTLEAWMRPTEGSDDVAMFYNGKLVVRAWSGLSVSIMRDPQGGRRHIVFVGTTKGGGWSAFRAYFTGDFVAWHHVVIAITETSVLSVFVNGTLCGKSTVDIGSVGGENDAYLGVTDSVWGGMYTAFAAYPFAASASLAARHYILGIAADAVCPPVPFSGVHGTCLLPTPPGGTCTMACTRHTDVFTLVCLGGLLNISHPPACATSCASVALHAFPGRTPPVDGEYTFTIQGVHVPVYCHNVASDPAAYVTLQRNSFASNFAYKYGGLGFCPGSPVTTRFSRIRLHIPTMQVSPDDYTFSTPTGSSQHVPYGVAMACCDDHMLFAGAGMDLRGTPYSIATAWELQGHNSVGGRSSFSTPKRAFIAGGGACGGATPVHGILQLTTPRVQCSHPPPPVAHGSRAHATCTSTSVCELTCEDTFVKTGDFHCNDGRWTPAACQRWTRVGGTDGSVLLDIHAYTTGISVLGTNFPACHVFDVWGDKFVMRMEGNATVDYFRPVVNTTLCQLLNATAFLWGPTPEGPFFETAASLVGLGGSSNLFTYAHGEHYDRRISAPVWGRRGVEFTEQGGYMSDTYGYFGDDAPQWGKGFTMHVDCAAKCASGHACVNGRCLRNACGPPPGEESPGCAFPAAGLWCALECTSGGNVIGQGNASCLPSGSTLEWVPPLGECKSGHSWEDYAWAGAASVFLFGLITAVTLVSRCRAPPADPPENGTRTSLLSGEVDYLQGEPPPHFNLNGAYTRNTPNVTSYVEGSICSTLEESTFVGSRSVASMRNVPAALDDFPGLDGSSEEYVKSMVWSLGRRLGRGSFGSVYMCQDKSSGLLMAVKLVAETQDDKKYKMLRYEYELGRMCHHPNVVLYMGTDSITKPNSPQVYFAVFMEYFACGSIKSFNGDIVISCDTGAMYIQQVLTGLAYLHERNVCHRDIKGENLLVDPKTAPPTIKIGDFGLALLLTPARPHYREAAGTPNFMAPEVADAGKVAGLPADVYSLGCTVVEMITGLPPTTFPPTMAVHMAQTARDWVKPPGVLFDSNCADFAALCLRADATARPLPTDLLEHVWMTNVRAPRLDTMVSQLSNSSASVPRGAAPSLALPSSTTSPLSGTSPAVSPRS